MKARLASLRANSSVQKRALMTGSAKKFRNRTAQSGLVWRYRASQ
jgi:hypothetical protein